MCLLVLCDLDLDTVLKDCDEMPCLVAPTAVWMVINASLVFLGSYLVTYHAVSSVITQSYVVHQ